MDGLPQPGLVDVAASALVALCALQGFFRGLSGELAALISAAAALVAGVRLFGPFGIWVENHTRLDGRAALVLAYGVAVLGVFIGMLVVRWLVKRAIRVVVEAVADRAWGTAAGALRGVVIVVIVLVACNLSPSPYLNRTFGDESLFGTLTMRALPRARTLLHELDSRAGLDGARDAGDRDRDR